MSEELNDNASWNINFKMVGSVLYQLIYWLEKHLPLCLTSFLFAR